MSNRPRPQPSLWETYNKQLERNPLRTKILTSAAITATSDVVAQVFFEKKPLRNVDVARLLKFVLYAIIVTPIYSRWYQFLGRLDQTLDKKSTFLARLKRTNYYFHKFLTSVIKLALDQLLVDPLMTAFFFIVMGILNGQSPADIRAKLDKEWWSVQKMSWRVWPLFNFIMLTCVPENLQILFGNSVAFAWNIYKSLLLS
eukprot:TRINITY_DN7771_c0_g1_i1.p1 TRINITY_DN7771_c0_g1~~TRINITY_DN7771_c0_g1_i1.p1  ORF type:complete len:200 (-),score=30.96 TRINITY_DN7771_c0_g1_i1:58-657(-)